MGSSFVLLFLLCLDDYDYDYDRWLSETALPCSYVGEERGHHILRDSCYTLGNRIYCTDRIIYYWHYGGGVRGERGRFPTAVNFH